MEYLKERPTPLHKIKIKKFARNMEVVDVRAEAQRVRQAVDTAALKERLSDWPASSDTGYRDGDSVNWKSAFLGRPQPSDPVKLRRKLGAFLMSARAELADACARYDAIRVNGLSEISDYDLTLSGWQECPPTMQAWRALNSALHLTHNHTTYQRTLVRSLMDKLDALDETLGGAGSVDIPPGFEALDIDLAPHHAFIARKWEAAALAKIGNSQGQRLSRETSKLYVLPAHQAYQVRKWALQRAAKNLASNNEMSDAELGLVCGKQMEDGRYFIEIALKPFRDNEVSWVTGWDIRVGNIVDEYRPLRVQPPYYELYRPASTRSDDYRISCSEGAFGASVVLEQLKLKLLPGSDEAVSVTHAQALIRRRARYWNQLLLDLGDFIPCPYQKCVVSRVSRGFGCDDTERSVIVTEVCAKTRTVFAYEDKPVRYRTNSRGRRVVEFDPKCIQSVYTWDVLRPAL